MPDTTFDSWNGRIRLMVIEHSAQRYDTCGDWELAKWGDLPGLALNIYVSQTNDRKMNFALFIHELNEALVFMVKNGFTRESVERVDAWDKGFIESSGAEPGEDSLAPYFAEHMFASAIEHLVAAQIGLDWNDYTETIANLDYYPYRDPEEPNQ